MADLHAPWALRGESVVAVVRGRDAAVATGPLPAGLGAVPGPVVVLAERFTESPVGPYVSLSLGRVARLGLRPGICFTRVIVSSHDRRSAGRVNWGFPGEVASLSWDVRHDGCVVVRWPERGIEFTAEKRGRALPVMVPLRSLQRRGDGPVVVPARVRGRVSRAKVTVVAPEGDAVAALVGSHHGAWIEGARLVLHPARHPLGLLSSLQAPLHAPEPGLSCEGALASRSTSVTRPVGRAHASVG